MKLFKSTFQDVLVPALLNKAGMIVVSPGGIESWVGPIISKTLYDSLSGLPYTVLWKAPMAHLGPPNSTDNSSNNDQVESDTLANFIVKESMPLNDILSKYLIFI